MTQKRKRYDKQFKIAAARAGERQGLQDEGGGEVGRAQVYRALLQHTEDALIDRL